MQYTRGKEYHHQYHKYHHYHHFNHYYHYQYSLNSESESRDSGDRAITWKKKISQFKVFDFFKNKNSPDCSHSPQTPQSSWPGIILTNYEILNDRQIEMFTGNGANKKCCSFIEVLEVSDFADGQFNISMSRLSTIYVIYVAILCFVCFASY